jgi:predicted metal-dependent phosphoesterase TrpH
VHSTASDGAVSPIDVVTHAAAAGLTALALTDHDTVAGVAEAKAAGAKAGIRVIPGCEFSVSGPGGELHLLAYFLPVGEAVLETFLTDQREKRSTRGETIVRRLQGLGVTITIEDVKAFAGGGAMGRPHVARALVSRGAARDIGDAFDRYLGTGRPAFVPKELPTVEQVTALVREVGGVTSAAHLKDRGVRPVLEQLQAMGVDGVEVLHPSHDANVRQRVRDLATSLSLLPTGGTDWHGDFAVDRPVAPLGSLNVPPAWLDQLEQLHTERCGVEAK